MNYPAFLIDDELKPMPVVIEGEAEPSRILSDTLLASGGEPAYPQAFQNVSGRQSQIGSDDCCIETEIAGGELCKIDCAHTSSIAHVLKLRRSMVHGAPQKDIP